ncbi:MAG: hypothetical protein AB7V59_07200 [Gammaproteobacteria bacterium]
MKPFSTAARSPLRWIAILAAALTITACSSARPDRATRELAWMQILSDEVPIGLPRAAAEQVLAAHGMQVLYAPYAHLGERPDECPGARLYAQEYGAVRGLGARFDVRVIVCLDAQERVASRQVDLLNKII